MDGGIRRGSDIVKALCLGARAVLCADGVILEMIKGRWQDKSLKPAMMNHWNGWKTDTRPSVSAAITRTTREARRTGAG